MAVRLLSPKFVTGHVLSPISFWSLPIIRSKDKLPSMQSKPFDSLTRRQFIRRAACAALGTSAMTAAIRDLRFMNAAVAQSNISDYKALICIFLGGGNDANNLIIPTMQAEYDNYASIREASLALPKSSILNLDNVFPNNSLPLNNDGHNYGLHP